MAAAARDAFRHRFRVRYSEVDFQGIVYVAHYVMYFDHGIHEWFRALPYDYTERRETTGTDFHTVRVVVEYRRPLRFDEEFAVEVRLGRIGRSSLTFETAIVVEGDDAPRAAGEAVWVCADQTTMRSAPLPEELRRLVERLNSPPRE
ncbi:MAG: acyl-CoA thioesterase [Geminicoccales bacterium]